MRLLNILTAGATFGLGLGIGGMTSPAKVVGFLNVLGPAWDPTLAFVLGASVVVSVRPCSAFTAWLSRADMDKRSV